MKIVYIIAISSVLIACSNSTEEPTNEEVSSIGQVSDDSDLKKANVKGRVKSIKEYSYEAIERFGEIEKLDSNVLRSWDETMFNEQGNTTTYKEYQPNGEFLANTECLYDESGRHIEFLIYNQDGSLDKRNIMSYDNRGNCVEENAFYSDGSVFYKLEKVYDDKDNCIEENDYNPDGTLYEKTKFKYDDKNNCIEENRYKGDGSLAEAIKNNYDADGNVIETTRYDQHNTTKERATMKYDSHKNIIEFKGYNLDGKLGFDSRNSYIYDEKGNWTQKIQFINEMPMFITERVFEYYD